MFDDINQLEPCSRAHLNTHLSVLPQSQNVLLHASRLTCAAHLQPYRLIGSPLKYNISAQAVVLTAEVRKLHILQAFA